MRSSKLTIAGALVLSLAACHEPGHEFCDRDNDGDTDATCVALVIGAKAVVGGLAFHAMHGDERAAAPI